MKNPLDMKGKTALVTGAGAGIGAASAQLLAQLGANVVATDIDEAAVAEFAKKCCNEDLVVKPFKQDVTIEADWNKTVDFLFENFKTWDVLVNNAGIYTGGLIVQNSLEQLRKINAVNIESIFLGMKAAAREMKPGGRSGKGGAIVNMSSVAGLIGLPGHSAYGSSKGAVRSYTKHAAVEFGAMEYGIRVNSLHPGLIETTMGAMVFDDFMDIGLASNEDEAMSIAMSMTPLKRLGHVNDVANAVAFLASNASSFMTGAELVIDGGVSAA